MTGIRDLSMRILFFLLFLMACAPINQELPPAPSTDSDPPPLKPSENLPVPLFGIYAAQKRGADISGFLDHIPNQLFNCTKTEDSDNGNDFFTLALYYYQPNEDGMICSILKYKRDYRSIGGYLEVNSHMRAADNRHCLGMAREELTRAGWDCKPVQMGPEKIQLTGPSNLY